MEIQAEKGTNMKNKCELCEICGFYDDEGNDPDRTSLAENSVDFVVVGMRYISSKGLHRLARAMEREIKIRSGAGGRLTVGR